MRRLVAVVAIVCFGGCASTATIARNDGPNYEARIESSDANALYLRGRNQQTYRVPRENVVAIDHPGNVEILIGSLLLAFGGVVVGLSYSHANNESIAFYSLAYGGPGLALLLAGLYDYIPSVRAARAFEAVETPVPLAPVRTFAVPPIPPAPATPPPAQPPGPRIEEPGPEVTPDAT